MSFKKPPPTSLGSRRHPLVLGRSTNLIWTILPTIAVVAALFVGFSYISYFIRNVMAEKEITIRSVDGVVKAPKPLLEQVPPPSPEEAMAAFEQQQRAALAEQGLLPAVPPEPVLEEETTETKIELKPVELPPLAVPGVGGS
ncbi:MAG: hypothetical protein R3F07_00020 [Opitutaceae bacterium]